MNKGYFLTSIYLFTTLVLFLLSKVFVGNSFSTSIFLIMGQLAGLVLITIISINFFLASRSIFVEKLFNGLHNVYKLHKLIGKTVFFLILIHPVSLYLDSRPFGTFSDFFLPSTNNLPFMFGILGFYTLFALIFITLYLDIPYKLWKRTHEYMGLVILFGGFHSMLISSDIARFLPLKIWIIFTILFSLSFYIYKRFIYYLIKPKNNYKIVTVIKDKNYAIITLIPTQKEKTLYFKAGQFAFFSIGNTRDEHPLSIWNTQDNKILVGIKIVGEFTKKLAELKAGTMISVHGPFGVFGNDIQNENNNELVFISAGIGITPFLLLLKGLNNNQKLTFINTMHSTDSAIFQKEIVKFTSNINNINFINVYSDKTGRITEKFIKENINISSKTKIYICGPIEMTNDVTMKLINLGIKRKQIAFEDFSLK